MIYVLGATIAISTAINMVTFFHRGTLDLNLKHAAIEKKSNHDIHARKMREKERDLKYGSGWIFNFLFYVMYLKSQVFFCCFTLYS